jgi:hypothetical protein
MEGVDELVIAGYLACRCGAWIVDPGPRAAVVLCDDCRGALKDRSDAGRLRYEVNGRTYEAKPRPKRRPPRRKPRTNSRLTPEQRDVRRRTDRARMRTYVRLARIYRPMYELIFAQEKAREGLDPAVRSSIPRPKAIEAEILRDLAEAEEREGRERLDDAG